MLNKGSCRNNVMMINGKRVLLTFSTYLEKNGLSYGDCNFEGLQILPMIVSFMQNKIVRMLTLNYVNIQCTTLLFQSMQQNHVEIHNNFTTFLRISCFVHTESTPDSSSLCF